MTPKYYKAQLEVHAYMQRGKNETPTGYIDQLKGW